MLLPRGYRSHVAIHTQTHHTMDKKGFRIHNVHIDCSLPWKRYTETATGIIKTSHEIWVRRTQWVFHIGGYKKKHSRKVSFSQKSGKSPLYSKHQLRSKLTTGEHILEEWQYNLFSVRLCYTSGQKRPLKGTTLSVEWRNQSSIKFRSNCY